MDYPRNPLADALGREFPAMDFAVLSHGFLPHGRDYYFEIEFGTIKKRVIFTHVVEFTYKTMIQDAVWRRSWEDYLTAPSAAQSLGDDDVYVWGTNWSLAYPGFRVSKDDMTSAWSSRIGREMFGATLETDRFHISVIYGGLVSA